MKTLIIDNHTKYRAELRNSLPGSIEVIRREDVSPMITLDNYDLLVLSGGHGVSSVSHHPIEYAFEMQFVREAKIPILGICLGSEIITYALGGELKSLDHLHQGGVEITITDEPLLEKLGKNVITVYEYHQWGTSVLPPNTIACAHSDHGPEIIKHADKPIIAIQFHPEVSQIPQLFDWVLENFKIKK